MNEIEIKEEEKKTELLKSTICKGCTDEEMILFLHVCKRLKLDPFMKQIYPVPRWSNVEKRNVMSIQTSIDGFRLIAERTGQYSPGREPTFVYENGKILYATAYVKKKTSDGTWHEVAASAYYAEYVQKNKEGKVAQFWEKMPHVMLAKCAESIALRKAFPADLSSVYTKEEMAQETNSLEVETKESDLIDIEESSQLTAEQKNIICDLEVQVDDMSFINRALNHYKVNRLEDISPEEFSDLVQWLTVKINSKGAPKREYKTA